MPNDSWSFCPWPFCSGWQIAGKIISIIFCLFLGNFQLCEITGSNCNGEGRERLNYAEVNINFFLNVTLILLKECCHQYIWYIIFKIAIWQLLVHPCTNKCSKIPPPLINPPQRLKQRSLLRNTLRTRTVHTGKKSTTFDLPRPLPLPAWLATKIAWSKQPNKFLDTLCFHFLIPTVLLI